MSSSETTFKGVSVSRPQVIAALDAFAAQYPDPNMYEGWLDKSYFKHVLVYKNRSFPPKHILSVVADISIKDFSGGEDTNRVFRDLGFEIVPK